jgi:hypothetical protein
MSVLLLLNGNVSVAKLYRVGGDEKIDVTGVKDSQQTVRVSIQVSSEYKTKYYGHIRLLSHKVHDFKHKEHGGGFIINEFFTLLKEILTMILNVHVFACRIINTEICKV